MTVIATDGTSMWADSQLTQDGIRFTGYKKIEKIRGHLVGGAGDFSSIIKWLDWFRDGGKEQDMPDMEGCTILMVDPEGKIWEWEDGVKYQIVGTHATLGSGGEYALALLDTGHSPFHAVKATCNRRVDCGEPIYGIGLGDPVD